MSFTTRPPIAIVPPPISSRPAIIRSSVDLPQPEGPTSTQNSPSAMSTSTPRITWVEPKYFCTAAIVTAAIRPPPRAPRRARSGFGLARAFDHRVVGASAREPAHDVVRGLASQLLLRLDGKERRVRRQDDTRVASQRRIRGHRLDRQHVERGPPQYSSI